jgi:hypothetical protein
MAGTLLDLCTARITISPQTMLKWPWQFSRLPTGTCGAWNWTGADAIDLQQWEYNEIKYQTNCIMTTAFNPRSADVHLGSRHTNIQGPYFNWQLSFVVGRDTVVGTATRYGMDGPEIESRWVGDFTHPSRPALRPNQPPLKWVPGLSREWSDRGVAFTTHTHVASRLTKEWSYTSTPPLVLHGLF